MRIRLRNQRYMRYLLIYFHSRARGPFFIIFSLIIALSFFGCQANSLEDIKTVTGLTECELIGFINAKLNSCGYCTGKGTGLSDNYGKDCAGNCMGNAQVDCNGDCQGTAQIDPCTKTCIGGNTGVTEETISGGNRRDCSGACFGTTPFRDNHCNQCSVGGIKPPFQDCNGDCYAPNQFEEMRATEKCGRCVGGRSSIPMSEVIDACGNCKTDDVPCSCNSTHLEDLCNVCGGKNDTCVAVERFEPLAIPANITTTITIFGAFRGRKKNIECLFKVSDDDEGIRTQAKLIGKALSCRPRLDKGNYKVGIYLSDAQSDQAISEKRLLVYESNGYFLRMSPTSIAYNDPRETITVYFQGDNLPPASVMCFVNGEDWPDKWRIIRGDMYSCELPLPDTSQNVTITPSFSGIDDTQQRFTFSFFSPPVAFAQGTSLSEDKTALIVTFDRPVYVCDLEDCSALLDDSTIEKLNDDVKCEWATKQQLVMKTTNPVEESSFLVTFKPNVLKEDNQKVAKFKTSDLDVEVGVISQSTFNPSLLISGPEKVPQCGEFSLTGHFILPGESTVFRWTVWRSDRHYTSSALTEIVESTQSATLTLEATLLDDDVDYTFELQASPESDSTKKMKKSHTLRKMPYNSPIITIVSDPVPGKQIMADEEITLSTIVTIPECFLPHELCYVQWASDNPKVKFDFKYLTSPVYRIPANTLPADTTVTFTARAFVGSKFNESSESYIKLTTAPAKLEAIIEGSNERIIGIENGIIELKGTASSKMYNGPGQMIYQWSCVDQYYQPCYDYSPTAKDMLLITRKKQASPSIQFHSNSLKPGQILKFGLKVYSATEPALESELSTVKITVINGSVPEVILKSVTSAGKFYKPNSATGAYFVPAGAPVVLHAVILSVKGKLKSVIWDVIGSTKPFTFSVIEENTYLSLGDDYLIEHGVYWIEMKACDTSNSCGTATASLYATPKVSLCKVKVGKYTAFKQTEATVTGCSLSQDRLPLTYQMVMHTGNAYELFTEPQYTDSVRYIGPPAKGKINLGVEVCDRLGQCNVFKGETVDVQEPDEDENSLLKAAERTASSMNNGGNPLGALCMYFAFSLNNNMKFTKSQIENMISYMSKSISVVPFTGRHVAALYSCIKPLFQLEDTDSKIKVLNAITRTTERAAALKVSPKASALNKAYETTAEAINAKNADGKLTQAARKAQLALLKCVSLMLPFGSNIQLGTGKNGSPYSVLYHQIIDQKQIKVKSKTSQGEMRASVSFTEEVKERFTNWNCKQDKLCNGVVISVSFYPTRDPYGANNDKQLSPVLDVQFRTPGTGDVVPVQNIEDGIKIMLSLIGNKSKERNIVLDCHYWDEKEGQWSKDGMKPDGVDSGVMHCLSSHLSSFTVLESANAMSTAAIAGIVVACLMAVFIIGIVLMFFVRKKQSRNTRVSTENLREEKQR